MAIEGAVASGEPEVQRLQLVNVALGVLICASAASAALASALRLQRRMALDGFLPGGETLGSWKRRIGLRSVPVTPPLVFLLSWLVPRLELVGVVSATLLLSSIAVFLPYAKRRREEPARAGAFRLPLHPLFPGIAAALCALFVLALPVGSLVGVAIWLLLGAATYAFYSGARSGAVRRAELELSDTEVAVSSSRGRLLIVVDSDLEQAASLIRFSSALAAADDKELLVLWVEPRIQQIPVWELRLRAEESWRELSDIVREASPPEVEARAIVRIAPTRAAGVLEAAREYDAELILLNVGNDESEAGLRGLNLVEQVFLATGTTAGDPGG